MYIWTPLDWGPVTGRPAQAMSTWQCFCSKQRPAGTRIAEPHSFSASLRGGNAPGAVAVVAGILRVWIGRAHVCVCVCGGACTIQGYCCAIAGLGSVASCPFGGSMLLRGPHHVALMAAQEY